ncbi:MAG: DUF3179 domain-containing protein [Planctomycetota bacterium]|jgi:hypothetical protein
MVTITRKTCSFLAVTIVFSVTVMTAPDAWAEGEQDLVGPVERGLPGWRTNTARRIVELYELEAGGPGKDGIPAIDRPKFVKTEMAHKWLKPREPVISLVVNGEAKAYPLQILIWHEIVNDRIGGVPVIVTFCPLCYSAIVFERTVKDREYTFGTSGMLRNSNLVMYDRQTESLWQQVTGEAIVGAMVGSTLRGLPAQIISFEQFRSAYKAGGVLSRETGRRRDYGRNPYVGYDDVSQTPFLFRGDSDGRVPPMEKVIAVTVGDDSRAYPYAVSKGKRVINDTVGGRQLVVFHADGALSALDKARIARSREVGSTGVFDRNVGGRSLTFSYDGVRFYDAQTASTWDITGRAVEGPLKGKRLAPVAHGDYFAFVWLVFRPETEIYRAAEAVRQQP